MEEDNYTVNKQRNPVYYNEQIDQLILTPDVKSNVIIRKKPRFVKIPVYLLDKNGEKIPIKDSEGNYEINEKGEVKYMIKEYKKIQDGWLSVSEVVPASDLFSIDTATSNISQEAVMLLLRTMWWHNRLSTYQTSTNNDYSLYLHNVRNDGVAILLSAKSYRGGTVQAIKTFINKTDSKQWQPELPEEKKQGLFAPLSAMLGGKSKKAPEDDTRKYTAFQ